MFRIGVGDIESKEMDLEFGAEWVYCCMSHRFKKENPKAYWKDGIFWVETKYLTFKAFDDYHVCYEVKIEDIEKGKVYIRLQGEVSDYTVQCFEKYRMDNERIDILAFVKEKEGAQGDTLFSEVIEKKNRESLYTETTKIKVDGGVLAIHVMSTYQKPYDEGISGSIFNKGITSWIKTVTLDNEITFDFCNTSFTELMKAVATYCNAQGLELTVDCVEYMIPGHCIDVPCAVVTTDRFKLVFDYEYIKEVHFAESIMDTSNYTESQGRTYVIGDIVREVRNQSKSGYAVKEYGATNVWHHVHLGNTEYVYSCGFNL